jgi:diguanylate cyclase (GGDEF)-like protein
VVALADRILHFRFRRQFILASALVLFCYGWGVPVLNGGVASVTALGLLLPMPLISLAAPMRVAAPIIAAVAGAYVCVGVVLDAPSSWYIVMHLAGFLSVSVACALQGRTAAHRRRQLTRLSRVDPLTDCLNRRGFEERFTADLVRSGGADRSLGLVIFDLDGFKQLNDSAGHAAGDDLLRWVADTLRANLSELESLGRLGGDEFVVAVRPRSVEDVTTAAELLRTALAPRTSTSVGSAVLGPDGVDFETLYAHADAVLYADKTTRRGRRRSPAPPSTPSPTGGVPLSPSRP